MKNFSLSLILLFLSASGLFCQSSLLVTDLASSLTISNGSVINKTVTGGNTDNFPFSIKNTSGGTKTYKMTRFYDLRNVIAPGDSAYTTYQFCGQCYPPITDTSICSVTLTANQTDATPSVNLGEASVAGRTDVRWRIYEVSNPTSDYTEFTLRYNDATAGIKNISKGISSVSEIFPCPTHFKALITIHAEEQTDYTSLTVSNTLGAIVSSKIYELTKGVNNVSIDTSDLESGIYYIALISKDVKIQRKLVIEK